MIKQKANQSPYSLGLYIKCPKQYYFEYLDNYTSAYQNKKKIKQIRVEAGKCKELIFGSLLHIVLNDLFHLPEEERTKERLVTLLENTWMKKDSVARGRVPAARLPARQGTRRGKEGGFPDIDEERQWYRDALGILKKFHDTQNLTPNPAYLPEKEREDEFIKANFLKVPLRTDVVLAGKIDRMDKDKDGYHLIDYKTGRSERNDDFQLMAYSILATEALGMPPTKASYLYLRSGNLKSFEPNEEAIERTKARVIEIAEQIRNEKEFSPNPTKMCYYCDYLEFCPAKEEAKKIIAEYKGEDGSADLPF